MRYTLGVLIAELNATLNDSDLSESAKLVYIRAAVAEATKKYQSEQAE